MKPVTEDQQIKDYERLNKALYRIYALSFLIVFIVLALVSYGFYSSNQISRTYGPLIDAATEIQLQVTKSHLWFEEILSGDSNEDLQASWSHLGKADWYARTMLEGGENDHGKFIPLDNDGLKADIAKVRDRLESFRNLMKKRLQVRQSSAPGSDIDQLFDQTYHDVLKEAENIGAKLKGIMKNEFAHQRLSQKMLLGVFILLFIVLGGIYARFNRQRTIILSAFRAAKENLENEIDERKQAEEEIQLQNEQMQKRLLEIAELRDMDEERLADLNLANEQLHIAIDEADIQDRDKSEFFAGMTHEIRTPANAIIDLTYLTLDSPLTEQQKDKINTIKESAYSILSLLDSYMDILAIEYGDLEIKKSEFNIQHMLDNIIMTLSPQAHKKGIELMCLIESSVIPKVIGDKGRLWQILIHLVGNAIKFTVDGKIELRVKRVYFGGGSGRDMAGDSHQMLLQFSVCDTGIGIPEENLTGIFEHYSSSATPALREFGETRLGLHVSNKLVHFMGGEIWAESREGEGSTFHFTTMFDLPSESEKVEPSADTALDETGPSTGAGTDFDDSGELSAT